MAEDEPNDGKGNAPGTSDTSGFWQNGNARDHPRNQTMSDASGGDKARAAKGLALLALAYILLKDRL